MKTPVESVLRLGQEHAERDVRAPLRNGPRPPEAGCPPATSPALKNDVVGHARRVGDGGEDIFGLKKRVVLQDFFVTSAMAQ